MGDRSGAKRNKYVIGVDYGTLSARAVLVSVDGGQVMAESVYAGWRSRQAGRQQAGKSQINSRQKTRL